MRVIYVCCLFRLYSAATALYSSLPLSPCCLLPLVTFTPLCLQAKGILEQFLQETLRDIAPDAEEEAAVGGVEASGAEALEAGSKRKSSRIAASLKHGLSCSVQDYCDERRLSGLLSLPSSAKDVPWQGCFCPEDCEGSSGTGCTNVVPNIDSEYWVEISTGKGECYGKYLTAKRCIERGELLTIFGGVTVKAQTHANAFDFFSQLHKAQQEKDGEQKFEYSARTGSTALADSQAWLIPPPDVALLQQLMTDGSFANTELTKLVREQTVAQGLGQYAQHTCCPKHVNAYLFPIYIQREVQSQKRLKGSKRCQDDIFMDLQAFAIRAQKDIEKGDEILVHYVGAGRSGDFHKIFKCACCRCAGGCAVWAGFVLKIKVRLVFNDTG